MRHSLNRRLSIGIVAMLAVAGSYSALASTTPSFAIAGGAVPETTTPFNAVLTKGAKASSYSKVTVTTVDGTAHAGVDYKPISTTLTIANSTLSVKIPVTIIPRPGYQGPRTFKVHIAAVRYAAIAVPDATVTIKETEAPPPAVTWTKCADENGTCFVTGTANVRYGSGTTWTALRSVTGSIGCDNATWGDPLVGTVKECDTSGTVAPAPTPPPPLPPTTQPIGATSVAAIANCSSLWKTAAWDSYVAAHPGALPAMPTVTAGQSYNVTYEPAGQQGGLVPNTYTGAFVVAVPASGTTSTGGYEFDPICFPPPPGPDVAQWISAPLQDGSFARVKANDGLWDMTGPGAGRHLVAGEIVAVYFNGWGYDADGTASFAILALSDRSSGRAKAADLEGVAPVGTPPGLPVDWWVPGLVTANKTCTDPRQGHEGQPGVTQGGVYRAAMLAGSHMKLATGAVGFVGSMWQVFGSGDQNAPATMAATVVTGDCLTGA